MPPDAAILPTVDARLHNHTLRKLDGLLLPFLALLFLFNALDKANLGNAESAHFTTDIGLDQRDLNTALALFFAFFVALQPLAAALGRRHGMVRWVPTCMLLWGLCTALHAWVRHKWQLYTLRILIGCLEGASERPRPGRVCRATPAADAVLTTLQPASTPSRSPTSRSSTHASSLANACRCSTARLRLAAPSAA